MTGVAAAIPLVGDNVSTPTENARTQLSLPADAASFRNANGSMAFIMPSSDHKENITRPAVTLDAHLESPVTAAGDVSQPLFSHGESAAAAAALPLGCKNRLDHKSRRVPQQEAANDDGSATGSQAAAAAAVERDGYTVAVAPAIFVSRSDITKAYEHHPAPLAFALAIDQRRFAVLRLASEQSLPDGMSVDATIMLPYVCLPDRHVVVLRSHLPALGESGIETVPLESLVNHSALPRGYVRVALLKPSHEPSAEDTIVRFEPISLHAIDFAASALALRMRLWPQVSLSNVAVQIGSDLQAPRALEPELSKYSLPTEAWPEPELDSEFRPSECFERVYHDGGAASMRIDCLEDLDLDGRGPTILEPVRVPDRLLWALPLQDWIVEVGPLLEPNYVRSTPVTTRELQEATMHAATDFMTLLFEDPTGS